MTVQKQVIVGTCRIIYLTYDSSLYSYPIHLCTHIHLYNLSIQPDLFIHYTFFHPCRNICPVKFIHPYALIINPYIFTHSYTNIHPHLGPFAVMCSLYTVLYCTQYTIQCQLGQNTWFMCIIKTHKIIILFLFLNQKPIKDSLRPSPFKGWTFWGVWPEAAVVSCNGKIVDGPPLSQYMVLFVNPGFQSGFSLFIPTLWFDGWISLNV